MKTKSNQLLPLKIDLGDSTEIFWADRPQVFQQPEIGRINVKGVPVGLRSWV